MLFAEAGFATVFVPLHTAQQLLGRSGQANEVVLRVSDAADLATLQREVSAALPGAGLSFTRRAEEPAVRMLYEDIDNDQQFWNVIAGLVLAGAAFAAFNLTSRRIDAQRRQLGVGMALGTPTRLLVVWPLLVGVQIALLGMVAGVAVGHLLDIRLRRVHLGPAVADLAPFQPGVFACCCAGTGCRFWPRRCRCGAPCGSSRSRPSAPGTCSTRRGLLRPTRRGRPAGRHPPDARARHLRSLRRSLLTALAIGAAITTMVATIGLVDSFVATLDRRSRGHPRSRRPLRRRARRSAHRTRPSCAGWRRCPRWPRSSRG